MMHCLRCHLPADFGLAVYCGRPFQSHCSHPHLVSVCATSSPFSLSPCLSENTLALGSDHGGSDTMHAADEQGHCTLADSQTEASNLPPCAHSVCALQHGHASSAELVASAGGTPLYTAPEVLRAMFESKPSHLVITHKVSLDMSHWMGFSNIFFLLCSVGCLECCCRAREGNACKSEAHKPRC